MEIEKGKPWQSYLETAWNVQRRIADHYFAEAEDWSELLAEHDRWIHDYNVQEHYAHQHRKEGRRSLSTVLSCVKTPRFQEEDLERAFFLARHTRTVDTWATWSFNATGSTPRRASPVWRSPCGWPRTS